MIDNLCDIIDDKIKGRNDGNDVKLDDIRNTVLNDKKLSIKIMESAVAWGLSNGFVIGNKNDDKSFIHAPFTLLPSLIKLSEFNKLINTTFIYHKLIDKVSRDSEFLIACIDSAAKADPLFTGKLLELYKKQIKTNNINQKIYFGIFRNDFMKNEKTNKWGQIEFNTIAASFGGLSDKVNALHKYILQRYLGINVEYYQMQRSGPTIDNMDSKDNSESKVEFTKPYYKPSPNVINELADSMCFAAKLVDSKKPCIVMIVQPNEKNSSDQRILEFAIYQRGKVPLIRMTLNEIFLYAKLDDSSKNIYVNCDKTGNIDIRISLFYFRAGYTPNDYITNNGDNEWKARELIEFSNAIKCPNIAYHLIGAKLMQTYFADINILTKYLTQNEAKQLMEYFVGLYSLDSKVVKQDNIDKILKEAINNYGNYVMKPQREGGGNNIYDDDIPKMIKKLNNNELNGYILMERIFPETIKTTQIRNMEMFMNIDAIYEMGIYSTLISDGNITDNNDTFRWNRLAGTLLRTKGSKVTEGGVATGYSVLDSICLVND